MDAADEGVEAAVEASYTEALRNRSKEVYDESTANKRVAGRLGGTKKPTLLEVSLTIHHDLVALNDTLITLIDSISNRPPSPPCSAGKEGKKREKKEVKKVKTKEKKMEAKEESSPTTASLKHYQSYIKRTRIISATTG